MNVAQYTYQSPSTQQVQVGRIDPSSVKEQEPKKFDTQIEQTKIGATKQVSNSGHILDIYA